MKLSELKYITQDNIDESYINVTSAEMFAETQTYNTEALRLLRKRYQFLRDFWGLVLLNAVASFFGFFAISRSNSLLYRLCGERVGPCFLVTAAFILVFGYFIFYRKYYNWKVGLLITMILLVPVNSCTAVCVAANAVLLHFMEKIDNEIKDQAGYPYFSQLVTSYIRDEENADEGVMDEPEPKYSFDKYRIKPDVDMGMLADSDIGEIKK